jgi:hypothetical protein
MLSYPISSEFFYLRGFVGVHPEFFKGGEGGLALELCIIYVRF